MESTSEFIEERISILIIITILIDCVLFYILKTEKLLEYEKGYIYILFLCHALFYTSFLTKDMYSRDSQHMVFSISTMVVSLFLINKKLLKLIVVILSSMLIFWLIDGRCPIGNVEKSFGWYQDFYENNKIFFNLWPWIVLSILITKLFL
jgi:hypothetical protein